MIGVKGLMVGNIVLNENNKPIIITYDYMESLFEYANWDDLNPINLTPKILEQAGFEENGDDCYVIKCESIYFGYYEFEWKGDGFNVYDLSGVLVVFIEYLHELQNFYQFYNKTELPIDIDKLEL